MIDHLLFWIGGDNDMTDHLVFLIGGDTDMIDHLVFWIGGDTDMIYMDCILSGWQHRFSRLG